MSTRICTFLKLSILSSLSLFLMAAFLLVIGAQPVLAQQTLGGVTGIVTDVTGGILAGTDVNLVGDATGLQRTQKAGSNGFYEFPNLPIGNYTLTFSRDGFQSQKIPAIGVQGNRTATINAALTIGNVSTSVTVEASSLTNAVDTTNGYIMDKAQIDSVPLPTGSFTGELGVGESADLGEWAARYVEQLHAEWRGCF
jgi:hypothetical protein